MLSCDAQFTQTIEVAKLSVSEHFPSLSIIHDKDAREAGNILLLCMECIGKKACV